MSIKIMSWVWDNSPYGADRLLIHLALADWADDEGNCWPSQEKIAKKARCTTRWVREVTRGMVEDGLLEKVGGGTGRGKTTQYRLILKGGIEFPGSQFPLTERRNSTTSKGGTPEQKGGTPPSIEPSIEPSVEPSIVNDVSLTLVLDDSRRSSKSAFDEFWAVYPRKSSKKTAEKAFTKACREVPAETIIAAAAQYAADPNREDEFTKHPATWLNGGCWDDPPIPARGQRESGTRAYVAASEALSAPNPYLAIGGADEPF